jgi:hypothetical protein
MAHKRRSIVTRDGVAEKIGEVLREARGGGGVSQGLLTLINNPLPETSHWGGESKEQW